MNQPPDDDIIITTREFANAAGVSHTTVIRGAIAGKIAVHGRERTTGAYLFTRDELRKYLARPRRRGRQPLAG